MKIQNANTHSFDSVVEQLISQSIPLQRPALPELGLDCTLIRLPGPVVAGQVNVPVHTYVQSIQENPTSYENHNDTFANGQCTLKHLSAQFGFNNPQQGQGLELKMMLASHLVEIEKAIFRIKNSLITEANFASAVTAAGGSYAASHLETLLAAVPARAVVCLDSAYYVKTKSTWLPAGDEGKLREFSDTTGMGENVVGYSARPEAIALIYGYPQAGPAREVKTSMIRLPSGIDVQFSRWFTIGGRSWSGSLDICVAAEVGQVGALRLMKAA